MSNNPHVASLSSSLSTSPYALQSNLEALINRTRQNPAHSRRRVSQPGPGLLPGRNVSSGLDDDFESQLERVDDSAHRAHAGVSDIPRIGTIQEASYDESAPIMLDADDERDAREARAGDQQSLSSGFDRRVGRESRRRSYGATSEPVGLRQGRRRSDARGSAGTSRSRSKARTPPRRDPLPNMQITDATESSVPDSALGSDDDGTGDYRGRDTVERPLSPSGSKISSAISLGHGKRSRRQSVAVRLVDDSSGDEGDDVARGLVAAGGGAIFGGRPGLGMTPAKTLSASPGHVGHALSVGLEVDPAEELDASDLQLPVDESTGHEARDWKQALRVEIPIIVRSSIPVFFTQLAEWSLVLASVVSIGHLGTAELAASSLASMTASVSSFSILQGLATALDTLLPAAWTSSEPSRVGLWTQRASVVMAVSMIPMFVLWWNIYGVLIALGQEPEVAELASQYLRYLSFAIPGYGGNLVVRRYLQAQNLMHVPTYILFFIAPINLLFNWLFVWGPRAFRLGFIGGAVATAASYNLTLIISVVYTLYFGPREAFHPVTFKSLFSKLGTVTSLGLAGTIMLSSEWWAWEAAALAASILGPINLAAQSVLLSTASTFYQVPVSLGVAAAVRTGNLLGAGRQWEAKWSSRASLFLSVAFALVNSSICVIFRNSWGYLFNNDPEVVELVASVMPYIALFQITDGVTATTGAILRSLGLHSTGALINLMAYYVIGLPFGLWLTFTPRLHLGLIGLWIGLSVALGYGSILSVYLVWKANWHRAVERVRQNLGLAPHGAIGADGRWTTDEDEDKARDQESGPSGSGSERTPLLNGPDGPSR